MADPTADDVANWIRAGSFNKDDGVKKILDAIKFQFSTGQIDLKWRLTWDDLVVDEDTLTLGEWEDIEKATKQSWLTMKPASSPRICAAVLSVCYQHRKGMSEDEAREKVRGLNGLKVAEAFTEYLAEDPPKGSAT